MTIFSFANSITINKNSSATLYYSLRGEAIFGTSSTYFESTEIEIGPGETVYFNHPSEVPGLEYLPPTATFIFMKGTSPDCYGADLSVGCSGNSYGFLDFINNVCPPTISFIIMSGICNDDLTVYIQ